MSKKLTFLLFLIVSVSFSQNQLPLIPQPKSLKLETGNFILSDKTVIQADEDSFEAKYLQEIIKQQVGLDLKIVTSTKAKSKIIFANKIIEEKKSFKEWYTLSISKNDVMIIATEAHGIFYGIQTLSQLLPLEKYRCRVVRQRAAGRVRAGRAGVWTRTWRQP